MNTLLSEDWIFFVDSGLKTCHALVATFKKLFQADVVASGCQHVDWETVIRAFVDVLRNKPLSSIEIEPSQVRHADVDVQLEVVLTAYTVSFNGRYLNLLSDQRRVCQTCDLSQFCDQK